MGIPESQIKETSALISLSKNVVAIGESDWKNDEKVGLRLKFPRRPGRCSRKARAIVLLRMHNRASALSSPLYVSFLAGLIFSLTVSLGDRVPPFKRRDLLVNYT
jgi:hypothetical protein